MRNALAVLLLFFTISGSAVHAFNAHTVALRSDASLSKRVKGSLSASIGPRARDIEVIAADGAVLLQGHLPSQSMREAAISAAERTPGVRSVAHSLSVGAGS